jgi:hypothetical protein
MIPPSLAPVLARLKAAIDEFESSVVPDAERYRGELGDFISISQEVSLAATGSWVVGYANLYYQDFRAPPANHQFVHDGSYIPHDAGTRWHEKSWQDVYDYILEKYNGSHPDKITDFANRAVVKSRELVDELTAELAVLRNLTGYDRELQMLDDLTKLEWGKNRHKLLTSWYPTHAVNVGFQEFRGFIAPPHKQIQASFLTLATALDDVLKFGRVSRSLIRQLISRSSMAIADTNSYDAIESVLRVCNRFSEVGRQLQYRHDDRTTLMIDDEYDVQDLMHGLLMIFFDDVRQEEWTPSYAGGSSRIDFLLKDSEVALEIKKTRGGLRDVKVGEQLIIDIEKYRSHPNCKTLICFVYDPQRLIRNPRGLETDLSGQRDSLDVRVLIR